MTGRRDGRTTGQKPEGEGDAGAGRAGHALARRIQSAATAASAFDRRFLRVLALAVTHVRTHESARVVRRVQR